MRGYEAYFSPTSQSLVELKSVLQFFLFRNGSLSGGLSESNTQESTILESVILDILLGQHFFNSSTSHHLRYVESILWTSLSVSSHPKGWMLPINKVDCMEILKYLRKVLGQANWKLGAAYSTVHDTTNGNGGKYSNSHSSQLYGGKVESKTFIKSHILEMDEFMSILYLFSIYCRSIVMSFSCQEKSSTSRIQDLSITPAVINPSFIPLADLSNVMIHLAPGSASDIANAFLEAITHCHRSIWRKRFERFRLVMPSSDGSAGRFGHDMIEDSSAKSALKNIVTSAYVDDVVQLIDERFFAISLPEVPSLSVYRSICCHLPTYSEQLLIKVFEDPPTESLSNWWSWNSY